MLQERSFPLMGNLSSQARSALFAVGALFGLGLVLFIAWRVRRSLISARGKRGKTRPVMSARLKEIKPGSAGSPPLSSLQLWDELPPMPPPKASPKPIDARSPRSPRHAVRV